MTGVDARGVHAPNVVHAARDVGAVATVRRPISLCSANVAIVVGIGSSWQTTEMSDDKPSRLPLLPRQRTERKKQVR